MKKIDITLQNTAALFDRHFGNVNSTNRPYVSQDILNHTRNLCEAAMYKIFDEDNDEDLVQTPENTDKVAGYISRKYPDIFRFRGLLETSMSHITFGPQESEALMIKYIPKLIELKKMLSQRFDVNILMNINKYPLNLDESLTAFYRTILSVMMNAKRNNSKPTHNLYFIRKRSMKYLDGHIFYEYVFDVSDDTFNKFNTFVCYSFKNIEFNYDLKLVLSKEEITFLGAKISIKIIHDYEYSIRPCTFKNLFHLLGCDKDIFNRKGDYCDLMTAIKQKHVSLVSIATGEYRDFTSKNGTFFKALKSLGNYIKKGKPGSNIIKFLLLEMRNEIIKAQSYVQLPGKPPHNIHFDNLNIRSGSASFDLMPFAFYPKNTKTSLSSLLGLFDAQKREDEILYRRIVNYMNDNNTLFLKPEDIGYSPDKFIELKNAFNEKLEQINSYYCNQKIIEVNGYFSIDFYYTATKKVIFHVEKLSKTTNIKINNDYSSNEVLSDKQKTVLSKIFKSSSIAFIKGEAGTGKTTLIKEFIKNNPGKRILCLTTTNTANNNLKLKNFGTFVIYKTIAQFEKERSHDLFDIIIIDEASFVSTKSVHYILETYPNSIFLISGDDEQLESIEFGNWFAVLLNLMKTEGVVYTLEEGYRTKAGENLKIWREIRTGKKKNILEQLSVNHKTRKISDEIFEIRKGEVVLCLNYDGLYGINNVNRYLQAKNTAESHEYQQNVYKVGDPVVFITNDYNKFGIYNNLKGKIVKIIDNENDIIFTIELADKLNFSGLLPDGVAVHTQKDVSYVTVRKIKSYSDKYDTDIDIRSKLPFQISYAMSIHKAQGLEFDYVKIVITEESDELITKNLLYTAVTRAKQDFIIYWEPEVANRVLERIENGVKSGKKDIPLLKEAIKNDGCSFNGKLF